MDILDFWKSKWFLSRQIRGKIQGVSKKGIDKNLLILTYSLI